MGKAKQGGQQDPCGPRLTPLPQKPLVISGPEGTRHPFITQGEKAQQNFHTVETHLLTLPGNTLTSNNLTPIWPRLKNHCKGKWWSTNAVHGAPPEEAPVSHHQETVETREKDTVLSNVLVDEE